MASDGAEIYDHIKERLQEQGCHSSGWIFPPSALWAFVNGVEMKVNCLAAKIVLSEKIEFAEVELSDLKWCYGIVACNPFRVKIGVTRDWKKRFAVIQASFPTELEISHLVLTHGFDLRDYFFRKFKKYRLAGGWFNVDGKDGEEVVGHMEEVFQSYYKAAGQISYLWWDVPRRERYALEAAVAQMRKGVA